jgi:plastocyanin
MAEPQNRRVPTILLALIVPVVAVLAVVVTLSSTPDNTSAGGGAAAADSVTIKNFTFSPTPLVVKAGATVTVTNADGTTHTLTADNGHFDTGNVGVGAKGMIRIDAVGRYAYHCEIHNYMTGVIEAK